MVAAICITGIFIYFFFWSKKIKKEQELQWERFGVENEDELVTGRLTQFLVQRKRFNDRYWYLELEGAIQTNQGQRIKVICQKPENKSSEIPYLQKNDTILVYGRLAKPDLIYANRILLDKTAE